MYKLSLLLKDLLYFIIRFFIFNIAFIIIEFIFYKSIGITISFLSIYLNNYKTLFIVYLILYIVLNLTLFIYDKYYVKKLNQLLENIKGGENFEK